MGDKTLPDLHFLFTRHPVFPTFWTAMPLRLPLLVAWSAGPSAAAKAGWSQQRLEKEALHALTRILGLPEDALGRRFVRSYFHDRQADKFSRGAYSYVLAGGMEAQALLALPLGNRLFFAGEATQSDGHHATVHGAYASGLRAAEEILASSLQKS
jgi:monoamine oxidase